MVHADSAEKELVMPSRVFLAAWLATVCVAYVFDLLLFLSIEAESVLTQQLDATHENARAIRLSVRDMMA